MTKSHYLVALLIVSIVVALVWAYLPPPLAATATAVVVGRLAAFFVDQDEL